MADILEELGLGPQARAARARYQGWAAMNRPDMSEVELQEQVRELIDGVGLLVFHCADSRRSWGPGFPDLVIVGPGGVLYRELKTAEGKLSSKQSGWRCALVAAGADCAVWRPADLVSGRIAQELAAVRA